MRRGSAWWIIGPLAVALAALLLAGFQGWLGPLVTCGADGAAVCVAWPVPASAAVWLLFLAFFGGLAAWQAREWRRDDDDPGTHGYEPTNPAEASRARASAARSAGTNTSASTGRAGSSGT